MFDPRKQPSNNHNHVHVLDSVTTLNDSYNSWEPLNFGFQKSEKVGNWTKKDGGGMQFRVQKMEDHDDGVETGTSSPPLWKNSPPRSPVYPINYRSLSPSSRTQEIARGQWELMEMVKNMPESCYELSLKDIVEQQPRVLGSQEECLVNNRAKIKRQESNISKKNDQKKAKMMRSKSIENGGVYLKMVSPVSLGSRKNKKNSTNITKVSPKPEESETSSKSLEKDWWKKRVSGSSMGSNRTSSNSRSTCSSASSSTNSTNNSNRKRKGFLTSCWSKLCFSKSISTG